MRVKMDVNEEVRAANAGEKKMKLRKKNLPNG